MVDRDLYKELEKMLSDHGDLYAIGDIMELIQSGQMQSFSDGSNWVVTQVRDYPRKRVLEVFFAIGDLEGVYALEDKVLAFQKEIGADMLVTSGRLGWLKRAAPGWRPLTVNFVRA